MSQKEFQVVITHADRGNIYDLIALRIAYCERMYDRNAKTKWLAEMLFWERIAESFMSPAESDLLDQNTIL